ncbi:hypothetical protein [Longibacter salinarum]|nr:hypothetical protein [Longibacter salinarum]
MRITNPFLLLVSLLTGLLVLSGCETRSELTISGPPQNTPTTVTITVDNRSNDAWVVVDVQGGTDVTDGSTDNPTLRFKKDVRYVINNMGGENNHPIALKDADGSILLRQDTGGGSLSGDEDINFVANTDGIAFTFTRTLLQEVDAYNCLNHAAMEGSIVVVE